MANREHGEVEIKAGDKTLVFRLGVNELISIQGALQIEDDAEFFGIVSRQLTLSLKMLRTMIYHGLKGRQPEITEAQAGDIITEVGTFAMVDYVSEALKWTLPPPEEKKEGAEGTARPSPGPTST